MGVKSGERGGSNFGRGTGSAVGRGGGRARAGEDDSAERLSRG